MWNLATSDSSALKLIIGNHNYSSWSLRAWFFMRRSGLYFELERLALFEPDFQERLSQYSDAGRVPVLIDSDLHVWDSLAICEYLSEAHLAGSGWPNSSKDRAKARSIVAEVHSGFGNLRHALPMNCRAHRSVTLDSAVGSEIERIDQIWSDPWFIKARENGVDLGILDAFFAPIASRFHTYQIELSEPASRYRDWLLQTPELMEWYQLASQESEVIDDEEVGTPL